MILPGRTLSLLSLILLFVTLPAKAAWQAPKDNVITEAQVTAYLQILKSAMDDARAAGQSINNNPSPTAAIALVQTNDAKFKANLASHNMSEPEYQWVAERVADAWGATMASKFISQATAGLADQRKKTQQSIDEMKAKLADYQKAQASGRRIMTSDQRQSAIDSAKGDLQSALDEAKQHEVEIKQATDDAAKQDAQKARDEALAKAELAKKKIANPDLPTTDDEKEQVTKENQDTITSLNTDLANTQQSLTQQDQVMAQLTKSMQEQQAKNPIPPQNVELFKKHQADFNAAWGIKPGT